MPQQTVLFTRRISARAADNAHTNRSDGLKQANHRQKPAKLGAGLGALRLSPAVFESESGDAGFVQLAEAEFHHAGV